MKDAFGGFIYESLGLFCGAHVRCFCYLLFLKTFFFLFSSFDLVYYILVKSGLIYYIVFSH